MPDDSRQPHRAGWLILVSLVLLLAAGLRFARIDAQSLWYDEGVSVALSQTTLARIVAESAVDFHPPGYYMLLAGWQRLAGLSELALRMLSALASVVAVALVAAIGARFFGRWVGLLAALLAAVSPFQVWYAQETRNYALLALLSTASVLLAGAVLAVLHAALRGRFNPRRHLPVLAAYTLVNAAGLYTHYTFPIDIAAQSLVFVLWLLWQPRRLRGLAAWAGLQIATLLLYAPWLLFVWTDILQPPQAEPHPVGLVQALGTLAYGITTPLDAMQRGLIPLGALAAAGLLMPWLARTPAGRTSRFPERVGLVAAWLAVPFAFTLSLDLLRESFLRSFVPYGLALALLAALGAAALFQLRLPRSTAGRIGAWLARGAALALLIGGLLPAREGLRNLYANPDYARDPYREVAALIEQEAGPEAAVVLSAPGQGQVFGYYFTGPNVRPLPEGDTLATLDALLRDHATIYAIYYGAAEQDPELVVESTLNARAFIVTDEWYGHLRLVRYVAPAQVADEVETPSGARFGQSITLLGSALSSQQLAPGDALAVALFWQAAETPAQRYKVFVHLYGPDGLIAAQHDGEPQGGLRLTTTWQPGETVTDNHGMLLPRDAPPGVYQLMVGMYGYDDGARLSVDHPDAAPEDRLLLGEVEVR